MSSNNSTYFPNITCSSTLQSKAILSKPIGWLQPPYNEATQDAVHHDESVTSKDSVVVASHQTTAIQQMPSNDFIEMNGKQQHLYPPSTLQYNPPVPMETSISSPIVLLQERKDGHSISADNESGYCNTYSTSSTDYNREINVLRFYKEQQSIHVPTTTTEIVQLPSPPPNRPSAKKREFNICSLIRKMQLTAERPFWKIENFNLKRDFCFKRRTR